MEITGWNTTSPIINAAVLANPSTTTYTGITIQNCKLHAGDPTGAGAWQSGATPPNPLIAQNPIDTNNAGYNGTSCGIYIGHCTKVSILNNDIWNTNNGIKLVAVDATDGTYTNGTLVSGNTIHDCPRHGIDVGNNANWGIIDSNVIFDNCAAATSDPQSGFHSDCIQFVNNGWHHWYVRKNRGRSFTIGAYFQQTTGDGSDYIWVYNNFFYNPNFSVHGLIPSSTFSGAVCLEGSATTSPHVYNNTLLNTSVGILMGNAIAENNIVDGCTIGISNQAATGLYDYNLYYNNSNDLRWGSTYYQNIDINQPSGQEAHHQRGDPSFRVNALTTSADAGALTNLSSPAVGHGVDLSAYFTDDAVGRRRSVPWDIGTYEYPGQ